MLTVFTESQNGSGWKGPLEITWSNPLAEACLPTAGNFVSELICVVLKKSSLTQVNKNSD